MDRPNKLIGKLRGGCDLSIEQEFELYLYIKCLESRLETNAAMIKDLHKIIDTLTGSNRE